MHNIQGVVIIIEQSKNTFAYIGKTNFDFSDIFVMLVICLLQAK